MAYEVNFDGLVGPSHHYGGLAYGNLASMGSRHHVANPKAACLEGLAKMKLVMELGVKQAVLPPQERPHLETLRRLGFTGRDREVIEKAAKKAPEILSACWSSSSMWAANSATVSPSMDTGDRRVHFTAANLVSQLHRSIETSATAHALRKIFPDETVFSHHDPLPTVLSLADEGAANHTRFCRAHGEPGIELFVYGRSALAPNPQHSLVFPARQTREASEAIGRLHLLDPRRTLYVCQSASVIDAGVFHNDVIAVGNRNLFLFHESAFVEPESVKNNLRRVFEEWCRDELILLEIPNAQLSVEEAVTTYLFNSQIVDLPEGGMCLVAPKECAENPKTKLIIEEIVQGKNPIKKVVFVNVRQSMKNGGGPACLRLRVVLTETELCRVHSGVVLTPTLWEKLFRWASKHYRDQLTPAELADPLLMEECRTALDELTQILDLGSFYPFQSAP